MATQVNCQALGAEVKDTATGRVFIHLAHRPGECVAYDCDGCGEPRGARYLTEGHWVCATCHEEMVA